MKRVALGVAVAVVIGLLVVASSDSLGPSAHAASQARSSRQNPLSLSLIQLIARPEDFDGQYIRVFGFYRHEFEGTGLYLHREDYEHGLYKNGLWTSTFSESPTLSAYDKTYVLVEGRFNAKQQGHGGLWSGEISEITRMIPWPARDVKVKGPSK